MSQDAWQGRQRSERINGAPRSVTAVRFDEDSEIGKGAGALLIERGELALVEGGHSGQVTIRHKTVGEGVRKGSGEFGMSIASGGLGPKRVSRQGQDLLELLPRILSRDVLRHRGVGADANKSHLRYHACAPTALVVTRKPVVRDSMLGVVGPRQCDQHINVEEEALHRSGST